MITEEERQSIINEAVEKALLRLPEIIGNLMMNQANLLKLNRTFYEKHKEFSARKDVVASVVEKLESENPGLEYSKLLDKAVPLIKEQLKTGSKLDLATVSKPNLKLPSLTDHGEL